MNAKLETLAILTVFLPFLSFFINAIFVPLRKTGRLAAWISIIAIVLSLFSSILLLKKVLLLKGPITVYLTWIPLRLHHSLHVGFLIDPLSAIMGVTVALVASVVQIYSLGYMSHEPPGSLGRYYTYHSLFAFSMLGLTFSSHLLEIYIFWELVGLCSYLLIGFWYYKPSAARAALKAFWTTRFGDVGFAIGMVILWHHAKTFYLPELFKLASNGQIIQPVLTISLLLVFFGAMGKSAQFPLHVWLPDAMEGPTPVSALIHAATMVAAGAYLVARIFPLFEKAGSLNVFVSYIGAFTAFFAATIALVQEDIKRVLAYSTISQLGYMMTALGAGSMMAGFFHLFTHAFFKALLFLAAGSVIHVLETNDIWKMGKLSKKMPHTTLLFIIGALALSGIPPFAGFYSKDEIILITYEKGLFIPFLLILITVFLTAFYMFRVIFVAFFGRKPAEKEVHESPGVMIWPMWILGLLSIFSGFLFKNGFEKLFGVEKGPSEPHFLLPVSLGLALFGLLFAWAFYQKEWISHEKARKVLYPVYIMLRKKYWIDDFYYLIYRYILILGISYACGWFDRYIVDGIVNLAAWTTRKISEILRIIQNGKVQDYLYGIIVGLILLILLGVF